MDVMWILDRALAAVVLLILVSDVCKGLLMVFTDRTPVLSVAAFSFFLLRLLPRPLRERRLAIAMEAYVSRRKLYGGFAIVGGAWLMLMLAILIWPDRQAPSASVDRRASCQYVAPRWRSVAAGVVRPQDMGRHDSVDEFGLMKLDKYVDALQNLSGDDAMGVLELYPK